MQSTYQTRYRADLIRWRFDDLRMSCKEVSELSEKTGRPVAPETVRNVLNQKNIRVDCLTSVVKTLNLDIKSVFDFKLRKRDFESAVLNGGSTRRIGR